MDIFARHIYYLLVSYLKRWGSQRDRNRETNGAKTKLKNRPGATRFGSYCDCQPILTLIHHSFAPTYTHT